MNLIEILLIDYRWIIVCFFLLPASFFYNFFYYIRNIIIFKLNSAPNNHNVKVKKIQKQIINWNKGGCKVKMCTSRPGWQTMSFRKPLYKKKMEQINCNLVDIINVDRNNGIVHCEPLVNMGQLSSTLSKLGWSIPIVPELDDLTVGGLIMGTGVESSSHIYGLFQHICISYEIILANGDIVKCSKDKNKDLFYAIPWSYGTLGFLLSAEIKIIPVTEYIRLKYVPVRGLKDICKQFQINSDNRNNDYVEGLMYNLNEGVIMTGKRVTSDEIDMDKINNIGSWYKPWFFVHVQNILKDNKTVIEYIPLREYYHRHSRSLFWELQDIVPFGNNCLFRMFFGWLMPVKVSLLKLTQTNTVKKLYENNHLIQDLLVPVDTMMKCIKEFDDLVNIYPIWLCPFKLFQQPGMVHPHEQNTNEKMFVDIGVYGVPKERKFHPVNTTRRIEDLVKECNGYQMLYADTYRTEEEFRDMFDHCLYDKMRKQYKCEKAFPEVYGKINKNVRD